MTFHDLPANWPRCPLSDPVLAADVVDLCVGEDSRFSAGVCVLALRDDLTLARPVRVSGPVPCLERQTLVATLVQGCSPGCTPIVLAIVQSGHALSDDDRALHQDFIEVCRHLGVSLLSAYSVSKAGVQPLPPVRRAA